MSQAGKPTGFFGKLMAKGMAFGHKDFFKNTAEVLDLNKDDKLLEIGFGSGLFIKKYASHISKISGIDISTDMVNLANDINKELVKSGKAEFKKGEVASLPWADNEFSVVVGIETFYFWPEPEKSLREINRVLKPGGRIIIEMGFNKDDGQDHTKNIKKHKLRLYNSDDMKRMLIETGFSDIQFKYFKCLRMPFKGYIVTKGMIVKGIKRRG